MYIGRKIKELRKAQKISLTDLAKKSGVQIATLSRMENLKMIGTLESHLHIAKALGVDITQLYNGVDSPKMLKEADQRIALTDSFSYNDKASYEILTNNVLNKKMMPIMLRIEEGGKTKAEQNPPGTEKFLFVLQGQVTAHVGDNAYPLPQNHILYFDAALNHYFENTGKHAAKVIIVGTPVTL